MSKSKSTTQHEVDWPSATATFKDVMSWYKNKGLFSPLRQAAWDPFPELVEKLEFAQAALRDAQGASVEGQPIGEHDRDIKEAEKLVYAAELELETAEKELACTST